MRKTSIHRGAATHRCALLLCLAWPWPACTTTGGAADREHIDNPFAALEAAGLRAVETLPDISAPTVVITGATILPAAGDPIDEGYLVLRDGRVQAVGSGAPPAVNNAAIVDARGMFVTPGLIDSHSHLGVYPDPGARAHSDGNEATSPTTGGVWAEHSVWPQDPGIERAVAGGVTTIQVLPGSANLVGGRGVTLHMVPARGARAMRFPGAPETLKMACGENPKRVYRERGGPSTRMGNVEGHRAAFIQAQKHLETWRSRAGKAGGAPDPSGSAGPEEAADDGGRRDHEGQRLKRDLEMETLAQVLTGDILPQVHCYRADDMLSMVQIADEFGFQIRSFHHALEAYKIRDILAEKQISVSTWADWWGFKLEAYDGIEENAAMVADAGALAVIHSDSSEGIQRLNQEAAKAWHAGRRAGLEITETEALRWITWNAAWTLGIEDQVGSLEPGKRADVVVWDGHPFSVYSSARWVFVDGVLRWDRDRRGEPWSDFELGQGVSP
jgi:imidazolonepropionase-like amidohydrolase